MSKKKRNILIVLAVCLFAAGIVCLGIYFSGTLNSSQQKAAENSKTDISGIEDEWKRVESNVSGAPDTDVEAAFIRKLKKEDGDVRLDKFNKAKEYDAFRIYDIQISEGTVKENHLITVFIDEKGAKLCHMEKYDSAENRAEIMTVFIRELDKNYEQLAAKAKTFSDDTVLY